MEFSVVIPVFNSAAVLEELYARLVRVLESMGGDFEIICIDDASSDSSWEILKSIRARDSRVRIVRFLSNAGQHNAVRCGLEYCGGRYIITMDDDLQHPPEEIPKLVDYLGDNAGCDVVFGVPLKRVHSPFRSLGSRFVNRIVRMTARKHGKTVMSSFRCMRQVVREAVLNYRGGYLAIGSLICRSTARFAALQVEHGRGELGKSRYSFRKLFVLALSTVFNYSTFPLQVISGCGLAVSAGSVVLLIVIVYQKMSGIIRQAGFTTIV